MSIRTGLIAAMLSLVMVASLVAAAIGVASIQSSVIREAQARVDSSLQMTGSLYQVRLDALGRQLCDRVAALEGDPADWDRAGIRRDLDLAILNVIDVTEQSILTAQGPAEGVGDLARDAVQRKALAGEAAWGTIVLDPNRIAFEGGQALQAALTIPDADHPTRPASRKAMMLWIACPRINELGRVVQVVYGGRPINHNYELVDELRRQVFSDRLYEGKPRGTVTIFMQGLRVATNVLAGNGRRAVGTYVSQEVQRKVLQQGEPWSARAWVVDRWYISGYRPMRNPEGEIIGMLYVGLLEAPYIELRNGLILRFLGPLAGVTMLTLLAALIIGRRMTGPLVRLRQTADQVARGELDASVDVPRTFTEIRQLAADLRAMQQAIRQRDQQLRRQNEQLSETNDQLQRANRNYMEMLGFVTHELKSPLSGIYMLAASLADTSDDLAEDVREIIRRIRDNTQQMQDMVKNYLDLSRAERGQLEAQKVDIDLADQVVSPCIAQTRELFAESAIELSVECPLELPYHGDPELLRVALTNYLTNAAKYGRSGGKARLSVTDEPQTITIEVWNEGAGFSPAQRDKLFTKFSRLEGDASRDQRGTGLGLFLTKHIVNQHGGTVSAEAEPGKWARFVMTLPKA
jgi:two-component system NtrC family sensor kinase